MSSPHHIPSRDSLKSPVVTKDQDGNKWIIKPRALSIMWGGDPRYWRMPAGAASTEAVELLQVSWLEVTGSLDLSSLEKGRDYKVRFNLQLKPDAFGWNDSPIYFMAKPGKTAQYIWRKYDLSLEKPLKIFDAPCYPVLKFTAPANPAAGDKLQFGMYEIWNGRWKGGLVLREVVIEPSMD